MCSYFKKLPNDPLVAGLKDIQIDWINYNFRKEIEQMGAGKKGKNITLKDSSDSSLGMISMLSDHLKSNENKNYLGQ